MLSGLALEFLVDFLFLDCDFPQLTFLLLAFSYRPYFSLGESFKTPTVASREKGVEKAEGQTT